MYRLALKTEVRRRGVARRPVAAGESRLRAMGARRISLLVWRDDRRAVGVWRSARYSYEEGTGRFVKPSPEWRPDFDGCEVTRSGRSLRRELLGLITERHLNSRRNEHPDRGDYRPAPRGSRGSDRIGGVIGAKSND
jgi:hypothetical protein